MPLGASNVLAKAIVPFPVSAFGGHEYTRREWREVPAGVSQKQMDDYANVLEYQDEAAPGPEPIATSDPVKRKRGENG